MRILPAPALSEQDIERFWSRVVKSDDCWTMGDSHKLDGKPSYAAFSVDKIQYQASAIAFMIHTGQYPENWVLHTCDNPRCVRPDHLFEGSPKENSQDMLSKGRGGHHKWERAKGPRIALPSQPIPSALDLVEATLIEWESHRQRARLRRR